MKTGPTILIEANKMLLTLLIGILSGFFPAKGYGYILNTELIQETDKVRAGWGEPIAGRSVAIKGNCMVTQADRSYVQVYTKTNNTWVFEQGLGPYSGTGGLALGIGDGLIAVGDSWNNNRKGAVYIYTQNEAGWILQQTLRGNNDYELFGQSLDIDGTRIVIGAAEEKAEGNAAAGAAYLYDLGKNEWEQLARFIASDIGLRPDDTHGFGRTVAISGNTIAVGAQYYDNGDGVVYVYYKEGGQWDIQQVLIDDYEPWDYSLFGTALAIDGDTLVVGERNAPDNPAQTGSIFIFDRTEGIWFQTHNFLSHSTEGDTYFGSAVALGDDLLLVGQYGQSYYRLDPPFMVDTNPIPGAVYAYTRGNSGWEFFKKLVPAGSDPMDDFGISLSIDGNTAVIGAPMGSYSDYVTTNPPPVLTGWTYIFSPDYSNSTNVAAYVRKYLYPEDAKKTEVFDPGLAAFRYKDHLYTNETEGLRMDIDSLDEFYGDAELDRAMLAEDELRKGLIFNPDSSELGNALLDIYYDRSLPKQLSAAKELDGAEEVRLSPSSIPAGLVIDDEVTALAEAREAYLILLEDYFSLFTNTLDTTFSPPLGYRIFQQHVPNRNMEPMQYLDGNDLLSVNGSTNDLYRGYKDLVFLYEILRDYGRSVEPIAQLVSTYNASDAKELVAESQQFLYLQTSILKGIFPDLEMDGPLLGNSGLPEAAAAIDACLADLENLKQSITSGSGLLGFEDDFLMLIQKFSGQSEDIFDSFDAFELRLNPSDLSSPLSYALTLQDEAVDSYADYRGFQDQLETQLGYITGSAEDRLFQIVGAYPDQLEYAYPDNNDGCEIWLQLNSIEVSKLQIQRNKTEIYNLEEEVRIEVERSQSVQDTVVYYGNKQASLTEWIGHINAAQAYADSIAKAASGDLTAFVDFGKAVGEEAKGQLEAEKERLAAEESAKIEGIESAAKVETLMLGMKTLAIDSQEAAIMLKQELGRLTALLREKEDLERTLAESYSSLAERYFADPTHHLRYQHQTMLANLSFDEAQKWLYFMARALEYKWNTPYMNYFFLGRKWSTDTLFKLRNAEELQQFYNSMVSFNSLVQLPQDDYFDWFSVKEDFLGYHEFDDTGTNQLFYVNPADPDSSVLLTATEAFRNYLKNKQDAIGNIKLTFSTRREIPGGTFYRGARRDDDGNVLSAGLFLDKIKWLKINLPGSHSLGRTQLAGELSYGGTGFVRNFDVGTFHPDRSDRLQNEETAYSTRYWYFHAPSAKWRFSESLKSPVTMQLSADPRVPPTVQEIDIFKERSVATTGWDLTVPTEDLGIPVLDIDELDDIELYFYHYAVSRQMPEGAMMAPMAEGASAAPREIPFPYNLRYETNEE